MTFPNKINFLNSQIFYQNAGPFFINLNIYQFASRNSQKSLLCKCRINYFVFQFQISANFKLVRLVNQKWKSTKHLHVFKLTQRLKLFSDSSIKTEHIVVNSIISISVEIVRLINENNIFIGKLSF